MTDSNLNVTMTLDQALQEVVSSRPDWQALTFDETRVACRELARSVNALAAGLHAFGFHKAEAVAVILPSGKDVLSSDHMIVAVPSDASRALGPES